MRSTPLRTTLSCTLLLVAFAPAARSGAAASAGAVVVRMTADRTFEPQVVTVRVGDEVVWRNDDREVHSVVGDPLLALHRIDIEPPSPPEPFHSGDVAPGGSFSWKFSLAGVYRYVCRHHEEQGMNGTVIVKDGAGARRDGRP